MAAYCAPPGCQANAKQMGCRLLRAAGNELNSLPAACFLFCIGKNNTTKNAALLAGNGAAFQGFLRMNIVPRKTLEEHAKQYVFNHGFSVVPVVGKKCSLRKWNDYTTDPADSKTIDQWFSQDGATGVAIVLGAVSGNLFVRDYDHESENGSYSTWKSNNPGLAATLPTVKTRNGYHVYGRYDPAELIDVRRKLNKPGGKGAIVFDDGELRVGNCYVLAPPSTHPDGGSYQWVNPLGELPIVPIISSSLLAVTQTAQTTQDSADNTDNTRHRNWCGGEKEAIAVRQTGVTSTVDSIRLDIAATVPTKPNERHNQVFQFARRMARYDDLRGDTGKMIGLAKQWHQATMKTGMAGASELETIGDFMEGLENVQFPYGELEVVWRAAGERHPPQCAEILSDDASRHIVTFCALLAEKQGGRFFLGCRTLGKLAGISHMSASRVLTALQRMKVIKLISKGGLSKKQASVYRYVGD